jgi:electron transport complex protein RnfB
MDLSFIYPALTLGGLGMLFGVLLGYASKKFEVAVDPKITKIREILPGANCGGCGFTGCDAYARAVIEEGASPNACTVGGPAVAKSIGDILGVAVEIKAKKVAFVKCNGSCSNSKNKPVYEGVNTCTDAFKLAGDNPSGCSYSCFGLGSCFTACKFDAIVIEDGVARVDETKCVNCGACIKACPRNLIESVPFDKKVRVQCNSKDSGRAVRENCTVGCISCKICEKNCEYDAIHVTDNLALVDYDKCTLCGVCTTKCPTKAVKFIN